MFVNVLLALAAVSSVTAGQTHIGRRTLGNWGYNGKHDGCKGQGSWSCNLFGKVICVGNDYVSDHPPTGKACPVKWKWHTSENCCVPPQQDTPNDCREGYDWDQSKLCCVQSQPGGWGGNGQNGGGGDQCGSNKFWHRPTKSCCNDYSNKPPPSNDCPPGKKCPSGWHWENNCCKPTTPHSPTPDCDNWNDNQQCCIITTPSGKPQWGKHKRDAGVESVAKRNQKNLAGNDLNPMDFCRDEDMIVCDIPTLDGKWLYECVHFKTELDSCGGCVNAGTGQDCTAIPHAKAVSCEAGECKVWSCAQGYEPHNNACRATRKFF